MVSSVLDSSGLDSLVGQPLAVELLTQAIAQQRIAPAYLFTGPDGVGRARAAWGFLEQIVASSPSRGVNSRDTVNPGSSQVSPQQRLRRGNHPDLLWVEPTYSHQGKLYTLAEMLAKEQQKPKARPQIRLEQVREVARFLSRSPLEAPRSLVVIEQAETMAEAAANGLLKTLEEPGQATLVLIAPSETALLPTIVSRCQRIPFYRLTTAQVQQILEPTEWRSILEHPQLLDLAQGSPGAAIYHWQQMQVMPNDLLQACQQPPTTPLAALELAKQITQTLDLEAQLWLLDYLQRSYWQLRRLSNVSQPGLSQPNLPQVFEQAKQSLLAYAQPQLVWEVTLLLIAKALKTD
jgi:DNA polymerase III subunit delta'